VEIDDHTSVLVVAARHGARWKKGRAECGLLFVQIRFKPGDPWFSLTELQTIASAVLVLVRAGSNPSVTLLDFNGQQQEGAANGTPHLHGDAPNRT
jgi:hypothetical protein